MVTSQPASIILLDVGGSSTTSIRAPRQGPPAYKLHEMSEQRNRAGFVTEDTPMGRSVAESTASNRGFDRPRTVSFALPIGHTTMDWVQPPDLAPSQGLHNRLSDVTMGVAALCFLILSLRRKGVCAEGFRQNLPRSMGGSGMVVPFFQTSLPSESDLESPILPNPRARKDRHTRYAPKPCLGKPCEPVVNRHRRDPKWLRLNGAQGSFTGSDDVESDGAYLHCGSGNGCENPLHYHRKAKTGKTKLSAAARRHLERQVEEGKKKKTSPYTKCERTTAVCRNAASDHFHFFKADADGEKEVVESSPVVNETKLELVTPSLAINKTQQPSEIKTNEPVVPPKGAQVAAPVPVGDARPTMVPRQEPAPVSPVEVTVTPEHNQGNQNVAEVKASFAPLDPYMAHGYSPPGYAPKLVTSSSPLTVVQDEKHGTPRKSGCTGLDCEVCEYMRTSPTAEQQSRIEAQVAGIPKWTVVKYEDAYAKRAMKRLSREREALTSQKNVLRLCRKALKAIKGKYPSPSPIDPKLSEVKDEYAYPQDVPRPVDTQFSLSEVEVLYKSGVDQNVSAYKRLKGKLLTKLPGVHPVQRYTVNKEGKEDQSGQLWLFPCVTEGYTFTLPWTRRDAVKPFHIQRSDPTSVMLHGLGYDSRAKTMIFDAVLAYLRDFSTDDGKSLQKRRALNREDGKYTLNIGFVDATRDHLYRWPLLGHYVAEKSEAVESTVAYYIQQRLISANKLYLALPNEHGVAFGVADRR